MKSKIIHITILIFSSLYINAQIAIPDNLTLKESLASETYDYKANKAIYLQPGFNYKATNINSLRASIDPLNIQPNPYPNNILGGSDNGIVGKIDDNFDITPLGQVSYNIPIKVPGGTGGVAPTLSIVYNSSSRDGLLGVGFDLAGLSIINRAPANMITDGIVGCVNFSETDKFMLDGMRLIHIKNINDTTYEYRTEQNSFTKIIASGINITKGDPTFFTAYTKDGLIYEYGSNRSTLKSQSNHNTSLFWLLRKVSDTKGNYFEVKYERDDANGEYWPIKIEYTGNDKAGLSPYNSIQFEYETNSYPSVFYISGMKIQKSKILKSINIYSGEKKLKSYEFEYKKQLGSDFLSSVVEITPDKTKINPTNFNWDLFSNYGLNIEKNNQAVSIFAIGNFGGTGFSDGTLSISQDLWDEKYSSITGVPGTFQTKIIKGAFVGDFNNDGFDDIILKTTEFRAYLNHKGKERPPRGDEKVGSVFKKGDKVSTPQIYGYTDNEQELRVGDFTGDGILDLIYFSKNWRNNTWLRLYRGIGDGTFEEYNSTYFKEAPDVIEMIDFNGDGISDIINITSNGCRVYQATGDKNKPFNEIIIDKTKGPYKHSDKDIYFGDFNGDGKTDIMSVAKNINSNCSMQIYFSTGNSFVLENSDFRIPTPYFPSTWKLYISDINNDGKDDFYAVVNDDESAEIHSYYNRKNGLYFYSYSYKINLDGSTNKSDYFLINEMKRENPQLVSISKNTHKEYFGSDNSGPYTYTHHKRTFSSKEDNSNLLISITDGIGNTTKIDYKLLNSDIPVSNSGRPPAGTIPPEPELIHERGETNEYPLVSINVPWNVVERVSQSNGIGGQNVVGYKYKNALLHKLGRGVLGFEYFIATDSITNTKTVTQFEVNKEQYTTAIKSVETYVDDILFSKVENTNFLKYYNTSIGKKIFTYNVISSKEYKYDINTKKLFSEVESTFEYDDYGNAIKSITKYGSAESVTNINTYTNDEAKWHLGRLTKSVVTKTNAKGSLSNTSTFEYNLESGILNKEVFEPDDNKIGYTKTYEHDIYGNIVKSTVKANNTLYKARISESKYDSKGRFEIETINNINNQKWGIKRVINEDLGLVLSETDANGLKTEYIYDSFGQIVFTKTPLGNTQTVYRWSNGHSDAPAHAKFFTYSETSGQPPAIEFFDMLGRSLRTVIIGFDGRKIYTDVVYNAKGQIEKSSESYFAGQTIYWNKSEYDALGRTIKQIYTDNTYSEFKYDGFTTTTISPLGHKDTKIIDLQGRIVKSTDNNGGEITYEYDPAGNCTKVIGARTTISTTYDKAGNRIKLVDPDLGTTEYEYNAYGELITQKDSKGIKTFTYDELGRLMNETAIDRITTYSYDSQKKGLVDKITLNNNNISQSFKYDVYGRTISTTETIDDKTYTTHTNYDIYNRTDVITYPSGFKIQHEYNTNGYLVKVKDAQSGKVHWQAKVTNAKGQIEQFTLGNNLTTNIKYNAAKGYITDIVTPGIQNWSYKFNNVGNLTERIDNNRKLIEKFDYDGLNRLTKVYYNGTLKQQMTYDAVGNITSKTGVGTTFKYENNTNKLLSVSGGGYNPPSWDVIDYTSFNKISYVSQGTNSLALIYGVGKERKKSITIKDGVTETKYYIGSLYEEQYINNGENKKIHYIFANGGMIAIYEQSNKNGNKLCYVHKDHLGSVQAYSNEQGTLAGEMSYDAWGRRRNPINWEYYTNLTDANAWHPRGFTGHEHLDIFEMINMNGRMYDPILGRFLSPDPFVQAPDYTQGLNRYAYCVNNPLSLVDPSGYSWFSKNYKTVFSTAFGIAVAAIVPGGQGMGAAIIAGALGGAASGFAFAVMNGANVHGIAKSAVAGGFWGGVSAGATHGIGTAVGKIPGKYQFVAKLSMHSSSQALIEGAKGGSMKHGFFSGAASVAGGFLVSKYGSNLGKAGKVSVNIVIAGTVSEIGGGKFANGAVTGAYKMLFNDLMHGDGDGDMEKKTTIAKSVIDPTLGLYKKLFYLFYNGEVAISISISYQISVFGHIEHGVLGPYIFIQKGPNKVSPEKIVNTLNEETHGLGGFNISGSVNVTSYGYTGPINQLSIDAFRGYSLTVGGGIEALGLAGSISTPDRYNDFLIGTTMSIGFGPGSLPSIFLGITKTTY